MNLAVGFFDGVHLGHRRILADADAAFTFRNHPATVFAPAKAPALVMSAEARRAAIAAALRSPDSGNVRMVDFTREFAALPPSDFAALLMREYPGLETVYCGPDWTFGAGGAGNADFLRRRGFAVETIDLVECGGAPVSSTRIRAAIAAGDLAAATACMGRPWRIEGEVVAGKGLGRELGFPTLNLKVPEGLVRPPCGVYAVDTELGRAVANWGLAPTMGADAWHAPMLEVHLLDGEPGNSPTTLAVDFLKFIRPERRFASLEELKRQIVEDLACAR